MFFNLLTKLKIMKFNFNKFIPASLMVAGAFAFMTSCNKDVEGPTPITTPEPSGRSLSEIINADASLTILKAAIARAGATSLSSTMLADRTGVYTIFAPTDAAFQQAFAVLGIPPAAGVNALRPGQIDTILRYHIVGQKVTSSMFPTTFPNLQLPSEMTLQAPSATLPPGLRNSVFVGKNGNNSFVNNVPVIQADTVAANGVLHKIAAVLLPPSQFLWDRINTDPNLTYLKAAIQRADSGTAAAATLAAALQNPGANLTVFAPTDAAMRAFLTGGITQALVGRGLPLVNAQAAATALVSTYGTTLITNPASIPDAPIFPAGTGIGVALATAFSPTTVKGIVVYHLLGSRAFTVNLPGTATAVKTLLNSAIPAHPGVTVQATVTAAGASSATVKGLTNATASNILINPLPAPAGTSDQLYINGVLHVIDQALLPQ
ncbi:MAG: fasciclin domain-containing protein [Chitinophagaceae bacterium]|nr:MAG: fasciclin domain-containing protein [Chitinophagaceae bacterium]